MEPDVAARHELNLIIGKSVLECALKYECVALTAAGREELAQNIRRVSEKDGADAGYLISSFDADGRQQLIEVKITNG